MRLVAVTNQKGGSGKTSSAVNLAAALGELGKRSLVVDLDPQGNASSWFGARDESRGLLEALTGKGSLSSLVVGTEVPGVDLVPSSPWLVGAERAVAGEPGAETILGRGVAALPKKWDFLFFDTPPALGFLSVSALVAAKEILVPVEPSSFALAGVADLLRTVETVRERLRPELAISAVLLVRVNKRTSLAHEVEDALRARFGKAVLRAAIPETVRMKEAPSHREPITLYAPASPAAEAFREAAREFLKKGT